VHLRDPVFAGQFSNRLAAQFIMVLQSKFNMTKGVPSQLVAEGCKWWASLEIVKKIQTHRP
jgi:hypothetical protein